jgi:WbqC-like protein
MTTLVVLQPSYLPWLGFFDQVKRSDVFVFYDDVQFDKNGWRNRNRVKTARGPVWLTVPVRHTGRAGQRIDQVEVDARAPWARKHLRTMREAYAQASFLDRYLPELADLLEREWTLLVELDIALSRLMCAWFGLERPMYRSSQLDIGGSRNERLLALCRHFAADRYLSGESAREYLDVGRFNDAGVAVEWQDFAHPHYPQLHGAFVPFMSAIDCVLNVGEGCGALLEARAGARSAAMIEE